MKDPGPRQISASPDDHNTAAPTAAVSGRRRPPRTLWSVILGVIGTLVGLAPHVLHHAGLLAGTALVTGAGGTALFALLGLVASVPFLLRLRRRFHTWWAPATGLAIFTVMFSLSAFVVGPAINGDDGSPGPAPSLTTEHSGHH